MTLSVVFAMLEYRLRSAKGKPGGAELRTRHRQLTEIQSNMVLTEDTLLQRNLQLGNGTHGLEGRVHVTCVAQIYESDG